MLAGPVPPLLSCQELSRSHAGRPLFSGLSLSIHAGEKHGLIGPNGAGKSTLMRTLAGFEGPDSGTVVRARMLRCAMVSQSHDFSAFNTVLDAVALPDVSDSEVLAILTRLGLNAQDRISDLSGGWQKRVAMAQALVHDPDLLMLDEPTNHLDIAGMEWLESFLAQSRAAALIISHDREFLERSVSNILEIDPGHPGGFFACTGNYSTFLEKREAFRSAQQQRQSTLSNRVRTEIDWLRRGPKARTTKAEARIQRAHRMISELGELKRLNRVAESEIEFIGTERQTRKLLEARNLSKAWPGRPLFSGVDLQLGPGSRLVILGQNGSGKTTLMRILAGDLAPDSGTVHRAEGLLVAWFDQHRAQLPREKTLLRAIVPHGDSVVVQGRSMHAVRWAQRFLFRADQLEMPVWAMSGGEQARAAMARHLTEPADILFLDEPTNDLDIHTIEVLEESLENFPGAVVLISHDRMLIDGMATLTLGILPNGRAEFFPGYESWQDAVQRIQAEMDGASTPAAKPRSEPSPRKAKKLGYHEQREWDGMEARILEAEAALGLAQEAAEAPEVQTMASELAARYATLAICKQNVDGLYHRWAELEAKQNANEGRDS